jgi:hypothetical protein
MEEVDEHGFLFEVERSADFEHLVVRVVRAEQEEFDFLC